MGRIVFILCLVGLFSYAIYTQFIGNKAKPTPPPVTIQKSESVVSDEENQNKEAQPFIVGIPSEVEHIKVPDIENKVNAIKKVEDDPEPTFEPKPQNSMMAI